jgi:Isocitrate lyase family
VLIARTDADSATLLTSDIDEVDRQFCTGERTPEGFFKVKSGVEVRSQNPQNPQRRSCNPRVRLPAVCARRAALFRNCLVPYLCFYRAWS